MELKDTPEIALSKYDELNAKLISLQDLILKMKVNYDLVARSQIKTDMYSNLLISTEELVNNFLDNRPPQCEIINQCTTLVQKLVMKVLRVFSEKGYNNANQLLKRYLAGFDSYSANGECQDKSCFRSAKSILISIKEYIDTSKQNSISEFNELLKQDKEFELFEGNEKKESKIMSVLGNETRIKILKELTKGSKYYTQLEKVLGLRGGHFHFHLKELRNALLVETDDRDRSYHITPKGLTALKMLYEISKE